jgi:hypothetical protein
MSKEKGKMLDELSDLMTEFSQTTMRLNALNAAIREKAFQIGLLDGCTEKQRKEETK